MLMLALSILNSGSRSLLQAAPISPSVAFDDRNPTCAPIGTLSLGTSPQSLGMYATTAAKFTSPDLMFRSTTVSAGVSGVVGVNWNLYSGLNVAAACASLPAKNITSASAPTTAAS